jgi:hypothetical protein
LRRCSRISGNYSNGESVGDGKERGEGVGSRLRDKDKRSINAIKISKNNKNILFIVLFGRASWFPYW